MERRQFLSTSALTMMGLPALATMLQTNPALADQARQMVIEIMGQKISDDESDYASWIVSPATPGGQIRFQILWKSDEVGNEAVCKLVRFAKGVSVPRHMHPEGELTCVLAGNYLQARGTQSDSGAIELDRYSKGDVIWMPAKSIHGAATLDGDTGVTILTFTPKNLVFKL